MHGGSVCRPLSPAARLGSASFVVRWLQLSPLAWLPRRQQTRHARLRKGAAASQRPRRPGPPNAPRVSSASCLSSVLHVATTAAGCARPSLSSGCPSARTLFSLPASLRSWAGRPGDAAVTSEARRQQASAASLHGPWTRYLLGTMAVPVGTAASSGCPLPPPAPTHVPASLCFSFPVLPPGRCPETVTQCRDDPKTSQARQPAVPCLRAGKQTDALSSPLLGQSVTAQEQEGPLS